MKTNNKFDGFGRKTKNPNSEITNNAVIYTRVSSKEQVDNNSLNNQAVEIRKFAKKYGLNIVKEYGGTYESAKTDSRKEFSKMIKELTRIKPKVSYLLVYNEKRFSRTGLDAIALTSELKKKGIIVIPMSNSSSGLKRNSKDDLMFGIQLLFANQDNQDRAKESIKGSKSRLNDGYWCGKPPFGYKKVNKFTLELTEDAKLIKKAFMLKFKYRYSNEKILRKLKNQGYTIWKQKLSKIYKNPFYCGKLVNTLLNGKVVNGKHPKIVSEEIFLKVDEMLSSNNNNYSVSKDHIDRPLTYTLKCNLCKKSYTGYKVTKPNGKIYHYYKCNTAKCQQNTARSNIHSRFEQMLSELQVNKALIPLLTKQLLLMFKTSTKDNRNELKSYKEQRTKLKSKVDLIEERQVLGEISFDNFKKYAQKYNDEISRINEEIGKCSLELSNPKEFIQFGLNTLNSLDRIWSNGDYETKVSVQNLLFQNGLYYDKQKDTYLTNEYNNAFLLLNQKFFKKKEKKDVFRLCFLYPGRDLNPYEHYCSLDFKSNVSTNSTTRARHNNIFILKNKLSE